MRPSSGRCHLARQPASSAVHIDACDENTGVGDRSSAPHHRRRTKWAQTPPTRGIAPTSAEVSLAHAGCNPDAAASADATVHVGDPGASAGATQPVSCSVPCAITGESSSSGRGDVKSARQGWAEDGSSPAVSALTSAADCSPPIALRATHVHQQRGDQYTADESRCSQGIERLGAPTTSRTQSRFCGWEDRLF